MSLCRIEICELRRNELPTLKKIVREIFDGWHAYYAEKGLRNHRVLIAKIGNEIVGFIQFKTVKIGVVIGHIYYMGVRKEYRRRGIGRMLVTRAEECLRSSRCIIASTQENNVPVIRLFRSLGYQIVSWRKAFEILRSIGAELEDEFDLMWKIYDYDDVVLLKLNKRSIA